MFDIIGTLKEGSYFGTLAGPAESWKVLYDQQYTFTHTFNHNLGYIPSRFFMWTTPPTGTKNIGTGQSPCNPDQIVYYIRYENNGSIKTYRMAGFSTSSSGVSYQYTDASIFSDRTMNSNCDVVVTDSSITLTQRVTGSNYSGYYGGIVPGNWYFIAER